MSATNDFDERARRKLAEREHPFDESAWEALQPQLTAMRDRERRRRFVLWFLLIGCLGAAGWLVTPRQSDGPLAEHRSSEKAAASPTPSPEPDSTQRTIVSTGPRATWDSTRPITAPTKEQAAIPQEEAQVERPTEQRKKTTGGQAGFPTRPKAPAPRSKEALDETRSPVVTPVIEPAPSTVRNGMEPRSEGRDEAAIHMESTPVIGQPEVAEDATSTANDANTALASTATGDTTSITATATRDTMHDVIALDSTFIADSVVASLPAQPRSKLELSVWGGPFTMRTQYTGARTTDWASTINQAGSIAFGAELMRQGEHFGFGAGLHYTSYVEQLDARDLKDELRTTVTTYELNGIDTTVLVVNGTVWINGQQYYMTQMLDTTIYVLVGTDSELVSTNVRRNGLARSNRTSYLEIPLLFDAHLRRGHWTFALRGGPMLGIIQGRRGVLPTSSGYIDLNDEAFTELVLGYTIQGQVRYQLGEAWTVGVGPALRGQLANTVQGDQLQRRANAVGGVITVGYRLP